MKLDLKPMHTGWLLYGSTIFFGGLTEGLQSDGAKSLITPSILFWLVLLCSVTWKTALGIKMYTSTAYADHQQEKKSNGNTTVFTKAPPTT